MSFSAFLDASENSGRGTFQNWECQDISENWWWLYPGGGAAETNAVGVGGYWRSAQPLLKGTWSANRPYLTSPPAICIPYTKTIITDLVFSFGGAQGLAVGTNIGWNWNGTTDGWDAVVDVYCHTDTSGSNPRDTSSQHHLRVARACDCGPLEPPLYTQCITGSATNRNAVSVRVRPRCPPQADTFSPPPFDGFITIGLKYTILEI